MLSVEMAPVTVMKPKKHVQMIVQPQVVQIVNLTGHLTELNAAIVLGMTLALTV